MCACCPLQAFRHNHWKRCSNCFSECGEWLGCGDLSTYDIMLDGLTLPVFQQCNCGQLPWHELTFVILCLHVTFF